MIGIDAEEAKRIQAVAAYINRRYAYAPKDLKMWGAMVDDIKGKMFEAGFVAEVHRDYQGDNWVPVVDIVARADVSAQKVVDSQGIDIEKIGWQARRESSDDLRKQGVDTTLIAR